MSSLNYVQDVTLSRALIVNLAETITLSAHSLKAIIDFEIARKNDFWLLSLVIWSANFLRALQSIYLSVKGVLSLWPNTNNPVMDSYGWWDDLRLSECDIWEVWPRSDEKMSGWWLTTYPESLNTDEPFSHIIKNPSKTRELVNFSHYCKGRQTWRRPWAPRWSAPPSWRPAPAPPPHLPMVRCYMRCSIQTFLPSG